MREDGAELSQRLEEGRAAFNRGQYFEAHELWEEAWGELVGGERIFVQGLIQIAAGLHHLQQRRPRPAAGLLRKGLEKVSRGVPATLAHLPIEALAGAVAGLLADLAVADAPLPDPTTLRL
jgi:predicted metal-dependent hydrolase